MMLINIFIVDTERDGLSRENKLVWYVRVYERIVWDSGMSKMMSNLFWRR